MTVIIRFLDMINSKLSRFSLYAIPLTFILNTGSWSPIQESFAHGDDRYHFCQKILKLNKGDDIRKSLGIHQYTQSKLAMPISAKKTIEKLNDKDWLVLDVRDEYTKKTMGYISKSLAIVSDMKKPKLNEFTRAGFKVFFKKGRTKRMLKKTGTVNIKDIKELIGKKKILLFCNGYTCHRSSFAACQLRSFGFPFEDVFIALSGFESLKNSGANLR